MKKNIMKMLPLSLALVIACVGCTNKDGNKDVNKADKADTTIDEVENVTDEDSNASNEDEHEDVNESSNVDLKFLIQNKSCYIYKEEDSYDPLCHDSYELIHLSDEAKAAYPALSDALDAFNKKQEEDSKESFSQIQSDAREWYDSADDKSTFYECYQEENIEVLRADKHYLSVRVNFEDYMGGAHGTYGSGGYNFDVKSGKELELLDVITDIDGLRTVVKDKLFEKYGEYAEEFTDLDASISEYLTGKADQGCSWFITPDGIDVYFGIYMLGSYAAGTQTVSIMYDENPELFADGFCKVEGNYAETINVWDGLSSDLDGDGTVDKLEIKPEYDEGEWINKVDFVINGNSNLVEAYGYEIKPYLVKVGGNTFVFVEMLEENDYRMTASYRINGNVVEKVGEYNGYITDVLPEPDYGSEWTSYWRSAFVSPDDIYLGDTVQIFCTHTGIAKAYINENGELMLSDNYYYALKYNSEKSITTKTDIAAMIVDKDSLEVTEENATIPSGTKISIFGTGPNNVVDIEAEDGTIYRVSVKSDDWPQTIDGEDIENLFDGILFAG
ncbi:MAG: DUF3298 and DUF4163 domain-containing protein [Lachnospiraceae bacterium]|nr:DUF3298 and DUF4163 domain-containing protein [Lachnospiraceae bacterium]